MTRRERPGRNLEVQGAQRSTDGRTFVSPGGIVSRFLAHAIDRSFGKLRGNDHRAYEHRANSILEKVRCTGDTALNGVTSKLGIFYIRLENS